MFILRKTGITSARRALIPASEYMVSLYGLSGETFNVPLALKL